MSLRFADRWRSFWFGWRLLEVRLRFLFVLVAAGLVVGYWDTLQNYWDRWTRPAVVGGGRVTPDTEFYCPMDPSVVRESLEPGGAIPKCPICGMPLSKRKKGAPLRLPSGVVGRVQLSPQRIRLAGIKTVELERRPLDRQLRTVGYVTYDETRRARVVTRAAGYLEKLYVNQAYVQVQAGDPLAEIYSPELFATVQELLISKDSSNASLAETTRGKLRLLGIDEREIAQIIGQSSTDYRLIIRSPHSGFVMRKEVLEGDSVQAGQTLFEVADLSQVWIEADIFETDLAAVEVGQAAEATVAAFPDRTFEGRVALIYPELQSGTRTNRVRLEVANHDLTLRPGMYATVQLHKPLQDTEPFRTMLAAWQGSEVDDRQRIAWQKLCPVTGLPLGSMGEPVRVVVNDHVVHLCCAGCQSELENNADYYLGRIQMVSEEGVLAVPERAVIDTGDQQLVYVEREPGTFEGVQVQLGPRSAGYYAVISGVLPGDRVAEAGAFLIDAETRLNPAASAAYFGASSGPSGDRSAVTPAPVTGAAAAEPSPPDAAQQDNLSQLPEEERQLAAAQGVCPITNLPLGSMGVPVKIVVAGETVFLCCRSCEEPAQRDAEQVAAKVRSLRNSKTSGASLNPLREPAARSTVP